MLTRADSTTSRRHSQDVAGGQVPLRERGTLPGEEKTQAGDRQVILQEPWDVTESPILYGSSELTGRGLVQQS